MFLKNLYSGCSYLLELIAIYFFLYSLCHFYLIPLLFIFIFIEKTNQFKIMFSKKTSIFRSSRSQIFKIGILKKFSNIYRKTPVLEFFKQCFRACTRDTVGNIHEYTYKVTWQHFVMDLAYCY